MAGIKGKDTKPELLVRRGLHARGFRFRLHDKRLPARPDLVLPRYRAAILVHGCFWHGHDCPLFKLPQSRQDFWREKIGRNRERDAEAEARLDAAGWRVLTVWECSFKGPGRLGEDAAVTLAAAWLVSGERTGVIRGRELAITDRTA